MIRVLVIEPAGNLWGSERALLDFVDVAAGLDIAVCCPPDTPLVSELRARRIRTFPVFVANLHQKPRRQRLRAALGVLYTCLRHRPDVIHLNQAGSYKIARFAARLLRIPIVAHVRIFEDAAYLAQQASDDAALMGLIAISAAMETEIRSFPSLSQIATHRLYDAYSPVRQGQTAADRPNVAQVVCVGRLVPIKGQDVLVRALAVLHAEGVGAECVFVGDGDRGFVATLKSMASQARLNGAITWTGFISDVAPALRGSVAVVCPSHREPLGRVIFEAWDAGVVPVAYAGSGGAAEIIAASQGGILYAEQTPESLARAIRQALDLADLDRERLVRNGRAWMDANCNAGTYARRLAEILSQSRDAGST